jgi:hypothetical protein
MDLILSVGGWAYSNGNTNSPSKANITTTFPLTTDILADFQKYKVDAVRSDFEANNHDGGFVGIHDALDNTTTATLTNAWASVAKAFGASGLDLDYEEQWLPAQAHNVIPDPLPAPHQWSFRSNFVTIKYAAYIKSLEQSAKADSLGVSIAAPAPGSFDVNDETGGDIYAGNYFYPAGQTAPLKGVIFNMLHPETAGLTALAPLFTFDGKNIINQLSTLGVMSYDLDDGYTARKSYWCLGWSGRSTSGYLIARDPTDPSAHSNVSCSATDQILAIENSFNQLGVTTKVDMGIESYYPNYPIDPNTTITTDTAYRWNDPFVPFDVPLNHVPSALSQTTVFNTAEKSCAASGNCQYLPLSENYKNFWLVPGTLAQTFKTHNNGVIFWSINNQEEKIISADSAAANNNDVTRFGVYGTAVKPFVAPLLSDTASWSDIISAMYKAYYPGT